MYFMKSEARKIDVVYTWCDGSDPEFQRIKQETAKKENLQITVANSDKYRYQDNDELKYSLRSVEKYAPWVNHIYIVTNNQRPKWLKENDKITIVDHKEIIPAEKLPTFNSVCIENYLVNIPGLSDLFLYFNDDIFLSKKTRPEDFFDGDKPIVRLNVFSKDSCRKLLSQSYMLSVFTSYGTVIERNSIYFPLLKPTHGVDAYSKKLILQINKKYPKIEELNTTPFRTERYFQRVIYSYEMAYVFNCPLKIYNLCTSRFNRVFSFLFGKNRIFCVEHQNREERIKKAILKIKLFKPICCCFNEVTDGRIMLQFLNKEYPLKSAFEI